MEIFITIGEPVNAPIIRECFVIEIKYMHGDADGYTEGMLGPFNIGFQIEELKEAITVCERMQNVYSNGKGGGDNYNEELVPGYNKWFGNDDGVPSDITCAGCIYSHATFDEYNVFFYDGNGTKFKTKIGLGKEE